MTRWMQCWCNWKGVLHIGRHWQRRFGNITQHEEHWHFSEASRQANQPLVANSRRQLFHQFYQYQNVDLYQHGLIQALCSTGPRPAQEITKNRPQSIKALHNLVRRDLLAAQVPTILQRLLRMASLLCLPICSDAEGVAEERQTAPASDYNDDKNKE